MPAWQPRKAIEDKSKTGDDEQLRVLWAVYTSVIRREKGIGREADLQRKEFSRTHIPGLREGLNLLVDLEYGQGKARSSVYAEASKVPAPVVDEDSDEEPELPPDPHARLRAVQDMLRKLSVALGPEYHPFLVNLTLFDFRSAKGGRARKSTDALSAGADDHYTRPFRDGLPLFAGFLLRALAGVRAPTAGPATVTLGSGAGYLPPTRFTATFPLLLTGTHPESTKNPKVLRNPQVPGNETAPDGRYAFLGSFGFSEPSYCTWTETPGTYESGGTRLSVGAYSLDSAYLDQILALWNNLEARDKQLYAQYGSAGKKHLEVLKAKFRGGAGHQLAITWGFQFVDIARALSQKAAQSPRTQRGKKLLASFMEFVQTRIDTREIKLQQIQQQGIGDRHNLFEYLWVFESTLWELALVSASCLSMADIASALRAAVPGWAPTVSLSETQLEETLKVGGTTLQRVYFPSGTAAAEELYQILWKTEFSPFGLEVLPQELSTFTPYFEFYQASATLLHRQTVQQRSGQDAEYKFAGTQIWLNLSDGLHSALLDSLSSRPNVGALIAVLASGYIQQLIRKRELEIEGGAQDPTPNLQRVCLVIDFTKFTGDMPNDRLYPLLVQLRETLLMITSRQHAQVVDVVFLRSNLKYNTGSLDRYQSGELLFAAGGEVAKKGIGGKLSTRASASFQGEWLLNGEYIPLMKRTYLLADAIGFNRWTAYSQTWAGGGASSTRSSPYDASLLALMADLVGFVDHPLDPIVSNLVVDIRKQSFKRHLGGQTTQRISTFWTQVVNDRNYLKDLGWKELGASTPRLRALAGALQKDLELIIEGIHGDLHPGGKPKPKRERSEAYEHLSRYLARLRDARKKLPNLDAITPVSTPALVAPVPPPTLPVASSLTPLAGKHCSGCDTVHGSTPSLLRRWHVCRDCGAIFCWWCGFKLKSYVFPDLDEVLDAMVKDYSNPNVRACTHCQGPTQLA